MTIQISKSLLKGGPDSESRRFNPSRLTFARTRRGLKKADLATRIEVTPRSITGYELGEFPPDAERLNLLASVLRFPIEFFYAEDPIEELVSTQVSFRSMTKMSATQRNIALGAGAIAVQVNSWMEQRFSLPQSDLPDLGKDIGPEAAAEALRQYWGLGEQPIKNMVHLLELKGVRVYSLAIDAKEVDAFSTWHDGVPFCFLNTHKSSEHSRFDAAHELGHLVMHKHGEPHGQDAEKEANAFASAFLMPAKSVRATQLRFPTLEILVKAKAHWGVSVAALNYRLHAQGLTTEWTNRGLCIQIAQHGYRTKEPNEMPREVSQVFEKVFGALKKDGITKIDIARDLGIAVSDLDELTYGLLKIGAVPDYGQEQAQLSGTGSKTRPSLKLIK